MRSVSLATLLAVLLVVAPACSRRPAPATPPPVSTVKPGTTTSPADVPPGGAQSEAGLTALRGALRDATTCETRLVAIDAIADLGQTAAPAIDDLIAATKDADQRVRWHAARALGMIGEDAVDTIPVLIGLLDDEDPLVVAQAAAAIGMIRADEDTATITPADDGHYKAAFAAKFSGVPK